MAQPSKVAEYRGGKDKLWGFFVGQVMKATSGKATPTLLNEGLNAKLALGHKNFSHLGTALRRERGAAPSSQRNSLKSGLIFACIFGSSWEHSLN